MAKGAELKALRISLALCAVSCCASAQGSGKADGLADGRRAGLWLDSRISRNWRAPINRPPLNRDELADDADYYDEGYLSEMAADRVNGLWIPVRFDELAESRTRMSKLASIVRRAARHGIGIWLMANDPACVAPDCGLVKEHPDWFGPGPVWWDRRLWCPSSESALSHVRESVSRVFKAIPGLAGVINISHGEGLTTCLSLLAPCDVPYPDGIRCPQCATRPPWQLHADVARAIVQGMRDGSPSARLLSWLYHPEASVCRREWVGDCARNLPDGVTLLYNFESGSVKEQLGRPHVGGDYWLSVPGPAKPFSDLAATMRAAGGSLAAKIQVGCSHEMASLPYVPVPGLLYRKFRGLRACGVRDVVQGWFFGNAPGVMNKAAGRLASLDFESVGESAFLCELAADVWGTAEAGRVVRIWNAYAEAYARYPLDNAMQYYGPFAAGIAWPLEREVKLAPLARTWIGGEAPSGDFIGECLGKFSLDEVCRLTSEMSDLVRSADSDLEALGRAAAGGGERRLDVGVMRAFRNLIVSAADVFAFYRARRDGKADEMDRIAARAIELSREMLALTEEDERLGWHPEAGERLFSPEKLRARIARLDAEMGRRPALPVSIAAARYGEEAAGSNIVWRAQERNGDCVVRGTVKDVPGLVVVATDRFGTVRPKVQFVPVTNGAFKAVLKGFVPDKIAFLADENPSSGAAAVLWPSGRKPVDGRLALPWVDGASLGDLLSGELTGVVEPLSAGLRVPFAERRPRAREGAFP